MKVPVIVQARQGSSRLPSKVMTDFCASLKMIEFQCLRLERLFDDVIVATTTSHTDDEMCAYLHEKNIKYFRGSQDNVMKRFVDCIDHNYGDKTKWFVRVGGDDPFISAEGIQIMINDLNSLDLPSNLGMYYSSYDEGMAYGCAAELFSVDVFREVLGLVAALPASDDRKSDYLEHTKPSFLDENISNNLNFTVARAIMPAAYKSGSASLSIDYPEDFLVCSYIANLLYSSKGLDFCQNDLIEIVQKINPRLLINSSLHNGFGE